MQDKGLLPLGAVQIEENTAGGTSTISAQPVVPVLRVWLPTESPDDASAANGGLPVSVIAGQEATARYVGRIAGVYPVGEPLKAATVDSVVERLRALNSADITAAPDAGTRADRLRAVVRNRAPRVLPAIARMQAGRPFITGARCTLADLALVTEVLYLERCGATRAEIFACLSSTDAAVMTKTVETVLSFPAVAAYVADTWAEKPLVWDANWEGELSFMYRYILCESCSQFDLLPLTSLRTALRKRAFARARAPTNSAPRSARVPPRRTRRRVARRLQHQTAGTATIRRRRTPRRCTGRTRQGICRASSPMGTLVCTTSSGTDATERPSFSPMRSVGTTMTRKESRMERSSWSSSRSGSPTATLTARCPSGAARAGAS